MTEARAHDPFSPHDEDPSAPRPRRRTKGPDLAAWQEAKHRADAKARRLAA